VRAADEEVAVDEAPTPAAAPEAKPAPAPAPAPAAPAPTAQAPASKPEAAPATDKAPAADEAPAADAPPAGEETPAADAAPAADEAPAADAAPAADEAPATEAAPAADEAPAAGEAPATEAAPAAAATPAAKDGTPPADAKSAETPAAADDNMELSDEGEADAPAAAAAPAPATEEAVPAVEPEPVAPSAPVAAAPIPEAPRAPAPAADLAVEAPKITWTSRAAERAFTDFLRAGIAMTAEAPARFATDVAGMGDEAHVYASAGQEVLVKGSWPRGQMFVAYRPVPGAEIARYVGTIAIRQQAGAGASRGVVTKSADAIAPGDQLLSFDAVRDEYERQRSAATTARASGRAVSASVRATSEGAATLTRSDDVLELDRGSADGVSLAWLCEFAVPGRDRQVTWGRVVKVEQHSSHVAVMKLYQPVHVGDVARLSDGGAATSGRARL